MGETAGRIIVLNGAPRSGKSSIVAVIQDTFEGVWMNLGEDRFMRMVPERYQPGTGLRPGGERPDLELLIVRLFRAHYESIVAHSRVGLNVVADMGHHDSYSVPRGILYDCARQLAGLPAWFIGVRCPLEVVLERRSATGYLSRESAAAPVPEPVLRWQREVHIPGIYDLEVDTSVLTPQECAALIRERMAAGPPEAFARLAAMEAGLG